MKEISIDTQMTTEDKKERNFVICSFYTADTIYEQVINTYLIPSIKKFNLPSCIVSVENKGSWYKNVAIKSEVILDLLDDFENKTLVFLDADATIEKDPVLFDDVKDYDIGYHSLDWKTWYNKQDSNRKELLTGTMFFNKDYVLYDLIKQWNFISNNSDKWEQKVLEELIPTYSHPLKIYDIPLNYCYIDSLPNGKEPFVKCDDVVIRHHQVSRQTKRAFKK